MRTWFDQPGRKLRRRQARKTKAAALGVRPLELLRPAVRGQTVRYNRKVREGRGFTLAELKEAGISRKAARGVGIVVDHRRRNLSEEGKALNVERLKAYKARLIVFPRNAKKPKKGDSTVRSTTQFTDRRDFERLSCRVMSSRPRLLVSRLLSPTPTSARRPARSPRRSENLRLTARSATSGRTPSTRASARHGLPRFVPISHVLGVLTNIPTFAEGGGGCREEEVNAPLAVCLLPLSGFFAPCFPHSMYSKLGTPGVLASHALCDDDFDIGFSGLGPTRMPPYSLAILYVNIVLGESSLCSSIPASMESALYFYDCILQDVQ